MTRLVARFVTVVSVVLSLFAIGVAILLHASANAIAVRAVQTDAGTASSPPFETSFQSNGSPRDQVELVDGVGVSHVMVDASQESFGELWQRRFRIINGSSYPVISCAATSDCSCTSASNLPHRIEPGQSSEILLSVHFGGPVNYHFSNNLLLSTYSSNGDLHKVMILIDGEPLHHGELESLADQLQTSTFGPDKKSVVTMRLLASKLWAPTIRGRSPLTIKANDVATVVLPGAGVGADGMEWRTMEEVDLSVVIDAGALSSGAKFESAVAFVERGSHKNSFLLNVPIVGQMDGNIFAVNTPIVVFLDPLTGRGTYDLPVSMNAHLKDLKLAADGNFKIATAIQAGLLRLQFEHDAKVIPSDFPQKGVLTWRFGANMADIPVTFFVSNTK